MITMRLSGMLAVLLFAACGTFDQETPEARERRQMIARDACIHDALASHGRATLREMERMLGATGPGAGTAVMEYTRAYTEYSGLRATQMAYVDSAVNHSRARADSVRYARTAREYASSPPEPGTLEANVAGAFARDLTLLRADTTHLCNREEG